MDFSPTSVNSTQKYCELQSHSFVAPEGELWCNWTWDSFLCWPATKASSSTTLRCPPVIGVDTRKFVEKRCTDTGHWEGRGDTVEKDSPSGWTNYTSCFTPETLLLLRKLYTGSGEKDAGMRLDIAERTRRLEYVGLSISLVAILVSLIIFCRFRSLRNTRTRIHKNLFVAMMIQIVIRLTLYIDQTILRTKTSFIQGIENTPIICEASYVFLEYAKTAMFMWMFIEGLFLNNVVSIRVFEENSCYHVYRFVGWGCPLIMTIVWAVVTALYHPSKCWWGYNLTSYFWILEGPRMAVILFNFLFLLNIIRTLVGKLRQSHISEIEQARKAVRAALVLLPLLGITNIISMIEAPLDKTIWEFALWSYTTHFLQSFQGLFIVTLYCFLNGEVRLALNKTISTYMIVRKTDSHARRQSTMSVYQSQRVTSAIEVDQEESRSSNWFTLLCRSKVTTPSERTADILFSQNLTS